MKPLINILAILAAIVVMDGHWLAMQAITWVDMAQEASSSEEATVADVLTGRVVCDHCTAIKSGKETEGDPVLDYLSQTRLLAPVPGERLEIPPRASSQNAWPLRSYALTDQATLCVLLPPPRA